MNETKLPSAIDIERSCLGAVLINEALLDEMMESLVASDFHLDAHRRIYQHMIALRDAGSVIDMLTLSTSLDRTGELKAIGDVSYLSHLLDGAIERDTLVHHLKIIREKALLRGIYNMAAAAMDESVTSGCSPESLLEKIESYVLQASDDGATATMGTLADTVRDAGSLDNYLGKMLDPVAMTGIPTGFIKLDGVIGGLKPGNFIVVAGRPGSGKSSFGGNLCENIATKNHDAVVALFALEMSRDAVMSRLLASAARVSVREARSGGLLSGEDKSRLAGALQRLLDKQIYVDDSSHLTPIKLRSRCRKLKHRCGRLDAVIVDYLQLMSGGGKFENREKEVSAISRSCKALSKELAVPVVALCQLSRAVEGRADKTPILSDLRESGSL